MEKYIDNTCREYIEKLASKAPVPGGGGTSALAGAIGTALGNMVGSLTIGKKKYAEVEEEINELMAKAQKLIIEFESLCDEDAVVFEPLSRAYGLPNETKEQREYKEKVMEEALMDAASVPIEIMEKCSEAIEIMDGFAHKGSRLAVSDAGVGAAMCKAALKGASLNVFINTKAMKDRGKAEEINAHCDKILEKYSRYADEIFDYVVGELR